MPKKEDTKLAETEKPGALASVPQDLLEHSGHGTGNIESKDIRPPRLVLAQAMHPQTKKLDPKYVDGLSEGDLFNDLTGEIYQTPVKFCVIAFLGFRNIIMVDGKMVDPDVPDSDPRTQWTNHCKKCDVDFEGEVRQCPQCGARGEDVEGIKPEADRFADYLLWLPEHGEVVTFSMKNKVAATTGVNLNSVLKQPLKLDVGEGRKGIVMNPPACARLFELGSAATKNDVGSWVVPTIKGKGVTDEENRRACYELGKSFAGKNIVVERDAADSAKSDGGFGQGADFTPPKGI